MQTRYSIDTQENLLRLQAWGELTADGLIGLLNRAQADPQYRPEMNALADYREANGEWDYSEIQKLRDYILRVEVPCEVRWAAVLKPGLAGRRRPRPDRHQRGRRGAHQDAHVRRSAVRNALDPPRSRLRSSGMTPQTYLAGRVDRRHRRHHEHRGRCDRECSERGVDGRRRCRRRDPSARRPGHPGGVCRDQAHALSRRIARGRGGADDGRQSAGALRGPHGRPDLGSATSPRPSCSRRAIARRSSWSTRKACSRSRSRPSRPARMGTRRTRPRQWLRRRSPQRWTRRTRSGGCIWCFSATPTATRFRPAPVLSLSPAL